MDKTDARYVKSTPTEIIRRGFLVMQKVIKVMQNSRKKTRNLVPLFFGLFALNPRKYATFTNLDKLIRTMVI